MIKKSNFSKKNISSSFNILFKSVLFSLKNLPLFTIFALIFVIIAYLFEYVRSFIDAKIIDALISAINLKTIDSNLIYWFVILLTTYFLTSIINQLDRASAVIYYGRFDHIIENQLNKKISLLDISYFEDPETNKLINKVYQNSHRVRSYLYNVIDLIGLSLSLIVASIIVIKIDIVIFLVLLICNFPSVISQFKFGKTLWGIWDSKGETRMHANFIQRYLTSEKNIPEVRIFGIRDYLLKMYNNYFEIFLKEQIDIEKKKTVYAVIFNLIGTLGFGYAYYMVLTKAVGGDITVGTVTFYIASISRMWSNVNRFFGGISKLYEDNLYVSDFYTLLGLTNKIQPGNLQLDSKTLDIEFINVWFKYPKTKKYIFKDFNLSIKNGDRLAVVGENGAGKTTLTKLLLRFYELDRGQILLNGVDIKEYSLDSLYKHFAVLTQDFVRYHFSASENIALNSSTHDFKKISESAKFSGADVFISKYKDKYNQILSKQFDGGTEPSVGQWQKIALARAFFKNSPVLILDEPTSAIDPKAEYKIFEKLFDFAKDKTVLIISHRFSTVRNADKIIVLDNGKIAEQGTHKELLEKNGMYKEAYDLQKKGYEDV